MIDRTGLEGEPVSYVPDNIHHCSINSYRTTPLIQNVQNVGVDKDESDVTICRASDEDNKQNS
jgi:hypothetical protein